MHYLFALAMDAVHGYMGIVLLMALESSVVPLPSEFVMPPAAYWASQGELNMALVILAGTFGSWLGSSICYWLSRVVGRPVILRWGRYVAVSEHKLHVAEMWVDHYGSMGIFVSRLLPVVRHLISIPAGICAMPFGRFSLLTILGAGTWCSVLAWFGARIISPEMLASPSSAALMAAVKGREHYVVLLVLVIAALYGLMQWMVDKARRAHDKKDDNGDGGSHA